MGRRARWVTDTQALGWERKALNAETRSLKFVRTLRVSPGTLYYALTNASALEEWLCEDARIEPHEGGRFCLRWDNGYDLAGEYLTLVPERSVSLTWVGRDEPGPTRVDISLEAVPDGTRVTLLHGGLGTGEAWDAAATEFRSGWERGLENLASVLEDGIDLRFYGRPMLGIVSGQEVGPGKWAADGAAVDHGILVSEVMPEMGAARAGLAAGDVVVRIDDTEVWDWVTYGQAIAHRKPGDTVELTWFRGAERHSGPLTLSGRPRPHLPPSPAAFADDLRAMNAERWRDLSAILADATAAEAARSPSVGAWSAIEVLAHLVASECGLHLTIAVMVEGHRPGVWSSNSDLWVGALARTAGGMDGMVRDLRQAEDVSIAMIGALPDAFVARKGSYARLADLIFTSLRYHTSLHIEQVRQALAEARAAATGGE